MGIFDRSPKPTVEPPAAPPPPPAAPATLTKDEIKELVTGAVGGVAAQLQQTVSQLGERIEQVAGRQIIVQAPGQAPIQPQDISNEEIDQAVLTGTGAAARIRALIDRQVNAAADRIVNQHVKPLQEYGVATMGELSRRMAVGNMPHYTRFKKEIDGQLAALDPAVRSSPQVIEMVYNAVVGSHAGDLVKEAEEAAVRRAQDDANKPPVTPGTGAGAGASRPADELPSVEKIGGDLGLEALALKGAGGQNADAFARGMGYKDWKDYMQVAAELQKEA